jgi:hypothetical protein
MRRGRDSAGPVASEIEMKKSLRKLSLSRETLRTLENSTLDPVGGGASKTTACQTTYTCPEICDPVVSADPTCLC